MMLVNQITQKLIEGYIKNPNATLLLNGASSGSHKTALSIATKLLGTDNRNNIVLCSPIDGKAIGVQQVRELKQALSTKTAVGTNSAGRVAIVQEAGSMTTEAQNGLLKLIEEPPQGTVIILSDSSESSNLIRTIKSRCLEIRILPITTQQSVEYAQKNAIPGDVMLRHMLISKGDPGLLLNLIEGEENHVTTDINSAKEFLGKQEITRIAEAKKFAKKTDLTSLLSGIERISEATMHRSKDSKNVQKWANILKVTIECEKMLKRSVQPKLVYLKLSINI